jgi:hypothetical protein
MTVEQAKQLTDQQLEKLWNKFEKEITKQQKIAEKKADDNGDIDGECWEDWAAERATLKVFGSHEIAEACGC